MVQGGLPPAIKSRCQTFTFQPVSVKDTMYLLKSILEKEELWDKVPTEFQTHGLATIASASKGSLRSAVQYLEQCIVGEYYTVEQIESILSTVDEVKTYKILEALLHRSKDPAIWHSIYNADPMELFNYSTLILADVMIYSQTGFIKDERFKSSTINMSRNPNSKMLFNILTSEPQLAKPYIRKADIMTALAKYYMQQTMKLQEEAIPTRRVLK
jgi:DNA polymerase III gamma/tau subunit